MEQKNMENYVRRAYTELNPLTGLYYNRAFMKRVDEFVKTIENGTHMMVAIDLEHFRLFNKLYGRDEGDGLLVYIAKCLMNVQKQYGGVVGYLGGDNYGIVMPGQMGLLEQLKQEIEKGVMRFNRSAGFLPAFGVYNIHNTAMSAHSMYDCATIALTHVFGNYMKRICVYSEEMEVKLEEEIRLLEEIQEGLEKEEFTFYVQPQCDISNGKIVGGESLVRWRHGEKGLVSPALFIPALEQNGFIADLDRYIWRKVCQWLREWIDRGHKPVPISINVSRIDIFSMDVPSYLNGLISEYDLPPNLLKVEITESAYAENEDKIIKTVKQLQDASFLVMMDDFGSGYSSLNMLKSVSVDVLKLDMRFLDIEAEEEEKGIGIIESVINMAGQMKIPIIVEGVEQQRQENFLLKMGCRYIQGYYYYKPMPVEEFEQLISDEKKVDFDGIWCKQMEQVRVRELLDNNLFSDTMLNNILGAAAFYDMYENRIEITRVNEQYYQIAGVKPNTQKSRQFWNHVRDDDRTLLFLIFEQAYENQSAGADGYVHYVRDNGEVIWVYMRVFFLRESGGHKIFYGSLTDMAGMLEQKEHQERHEVEKISENQLDKMEKYYATLPFCYGVGRIVLDQEEYPCDFEIIYANRELLKLSGGDMERLYYLTNRAFVSNRDEALKRAYQAAYKGECVDYDLYSPISGRYFHLTFYQYEYGYVSCMLRDMTHMHVYENSLSSIMYFYREVYFINFLDNYCRMIYPDENHMLERGNYEEVINRHFAEGKVLKDDEDSVRSFLSLDNLKSALMKKDTVEYKYRRSVDEKGEEWCLTSFSVSEREGKMPKTAVMTIRSIEALMREEERRQRKHMAEALATMSDGFFVYNAVGKEKIIYVNPTILRMYGCDTMEEFTELVGGSFKGMVHPEDLKRVEHEIQEQIRYSEKRMDFIIYRIIRKDGSVRWVDDCGHLEENNMGDGSKLFYVLISDITETITQQQKDSIYRMNQRFQ